MMRTAKDQVPMCCNCKRGRQIPLTSEVICPLEGVVSSSYLCKKYSYDWFLKKSRRKRNINTDEFSYEDFSIIDSD